MSNYSRSQLQHALKRQIERISKKLTSLNALSKKLSTLRLVTFLVGITLIYLAASWQNALLFWGFITGFGGIFVYLIREHRKVDDTIKKFKIWKNIRSTHLSRMELKWQNLPDHRAELSREQHAFASDLNIVGNHSLLQLIDTSIFEGGSNRLTDWFLSNQPNLSSIKKRQELADELSEMSHFRDRLQLRARMVKSFQSDDDWSMATLLEWLKTPSEHNFVRPLIILGSLSLVNIVLLVLWLVGLLDPYVIFTFVLYLVIYNFNSEKVSGLFNAAYQTEKLLTKLGTVLSYLETYPYKKESKLRAFCEQFHQAEKRPSLFLNKIVRLAAAASSQSSEIVWFLLNALVPWDLYYALKMETFKRELAPRLEDWLDRFNDLEALCALANFKWLNPHYSFALPDVQPNGDAAFKAVKIGHPLIPEPEKVTNDLKISSVGNLLLITGSNMAGKSTFLRTIGINLALCFAGGPVNAQVFQTIPFRIFTSINVQDSLDQGLSHFYAEVKRLRKLMDTLNEDHQPPLFFFVDEIYKGTNNRERLAGSAAFLKKVADKNGIGMVSTHDLELAKLENEISVLSNYHFEETIEGDKMHFEYKLKSGPCPTTNALKIMQMEGLPTE